VWHAEIGSIVLRRYDEEGGYEARQPFKAIAFAKMLGPGECFVEGALQIDGRQFSMNDWRRLARFLRDNFGIKVIHANRNGKRVTHSTDESEA